MNFIYDIIKQLFFPIISFLKQEGLWNYIISAYDFLAHITNEIISFINLKWNVNINYKTIIEWTIGAIKFIIQLFIALGHIIVQIYKSIREVI